MTEKITDEAKELRNEYRRRWYRENRDKVKAQQIRYWEKKARERNTNDKTKDD